VVLTLVTMRSNLCPSWFLHSSSFRPNTSISAKRWVWNDSHKKTTELESIWLC
jgi:hypothetical protein